MLRHSIRLRARTSLTERRQKEAMETEKKVIGLEPNNNAFLNNLTIEIGSRFKIAEPYKKVAAIVWLAVTF
jgi:hypothetical protein